MRKPLAALLGALTLASLSARCGMGDQSLEAVDPGAVPAAPDYATDVAPIFSLYCNHCHSGDALPWSRAEPYLDEQGEAEDEPCKVWEIIDEGEMPPGAMDRLTSRELLIVRRWASQRGCRDGDGGD